MFRSSLSSVCLVVLTFASVGASKAEVIWSQDFTGHADNTFPFSDFTGNSTNDWSAINDEAKFRVSTSVGNPSPALVFIDPVNSVTNGLGNLKLSMDQFAPFSTSNPSTPILRLAFDWKIETFTSSATNEAFRFVLRADNASSTSGKQLFIGFNRADLNDGDASTSDLAFYAATGTTSNVSPSNTSVIGMIPGAGWLPGFNFGEYNGGNADANDTDDLFYRFELGYNYSSGLVSGTVTRIASDATNGQAATFSVQLNQNLEFSNTDSVNGDMLLFASTNSVVGATQVDNITFEAVPEPASSAAILLGAGAIAARRRRR